MVRTGYHLVTPSILPFAMSCGSLFLVISVVGWMHYIKFSLFMVFLSILLVVALLIKWWSNVVCEGLMGFHTSLVVRGLRLGMAMFILSEVFFFFSFFWAFFFFSLGSIGELGCWPPAGITPIMVWGVPLLNTVLLISSGVSVTWSHYSLLFGNSKETLLALIITLILGVEFSFMQLEEYVSASFCISDGVYGSVFFMLTGFHGFHVLVGTLFIMVVTVRTYLGHFSGKKNHVGFEAAVWYWHFVDVVWIFLFIFVYWWGS